jgi:hypothetical protein
MTATDVASTWGTSHVINFTLPETQTTTHASVAPVARASGTSISFCW